MKKFFRHFTLLGFDRSFSKGLLFQLLWLLGIMCVVYIVMAAISYFGQLYVSGNGAHNRYIDILLALIGFGSKSKAMSFPLTVVCAILSLIIFSGMLISVISNMLKRRIKQFTKGETNYKFSGHVVVLGFNRTIPSLLRSIYKKDNSAYILLMSGKDSEMIREWVHANVEEEIEDNLVVMNGVRNTVDDLKRLNLKNDVQEIYVLGEENEAAHDAVNMECVRKIADLLPKKEDKVKCHVLFDSSTMYAVLQYVDIDNDLKAKIDFAPFNYNEVWARTGLATIPNNKTIINGIEQSWNYEPLDGNGITYDSLKTVHLVVIGMNEMGTALATNAAHILHFPNFREGDFSTCSTITFIDRGATAKSREFRSRFETLFDLARWRSVDGAECLSDEGWVDPMDDLDSDSPYKGFLGDVNFMDIQWEFIEGDTNDDTVKQYLLQQAARQNQLLTIAFCGDDSEVNAKACIGLPDSVIANVHQILVRQKESTELVNMLRKNKRPGYANIRPFGIEAEGFYHDNTHEEIAKLVNASYSGIDMDNKKIVENKWDGLTVALKWSNIYCANMLYVKLRFLGFDTSQMLSMADIDKAVAALETDIQRTEHNRWNTEKLLLGYCPLRTEEERKRWKSNKEIEKAMKKEQFLHLDILSNDMLKVLDESAVEYDINVNKSLSLLYKLAQDRVHNSER